MLSAAGHDVLVSFSRDQVALAALAKRIGAKSGTPARAAKHGDVIVLSVPWGVVDEAVAQAGGAPALAGKVVVDTTNQYGHGGPLDLGGLSGAAYNAAKLPGATWVKAFNTLASKVLAAKAGLTGSARVVLFYGTDDDAAATVAERLLTDAGFDPVRTGTLARDEVGHQEPGGELYNHVFHHDDAVAAVEKLRGTPLA
jgi:predicted dinucleotide-binding enzyme